MRALLYRVGHGLPTLTEVDIDEPRADEVLVSVQAAGVCHSDLQFMETRETGTAKGLYGLYGASRAARMQPGVTARRTEEQEARMLVMGHEPCGVVIRTGSGVTTLGPGDRVIALGMSNCGRCRPCLLGLPHVCLRLPRRSADDTPRLSWQGQRVSQFANVGAFAEQILVHETSLVKIGDDIPSGAAAILGCCVATGVGSALNTARVAPYSSVAVFGTGGIGMSALQGARIAGAATIVAVDTSVTKRQLASRVGATHAVDPAADDPVEAIMEITGGHGVDFSFETTAKPEVAQQAYDVLGLRGRLTCLSSAPADIRTVIAGERIVQGSYLGSTRPQVDIPYYLELYRQRRLFLDEMVGDHISPEDFASIEDVLTASGAARVVIDFSN